MEHNAIIDKGFKELGEFLQNQINILNECMAKMKTANDQCNIKPIIPFIERSSKFAVHKREETIALLTPNSVGRWNYPEGAQELARAAYEAGWDNAILMMMGSFNINFDEESQQ